MRGGVYAIYSKTQPRVYIGQAIYFHRRWEHHLWCLRNNRHDNPFLQNHFNKYGETDLEILTLVNSENNLTELEMAQIQNHRQLGFCLFNIQLPENTRQRTPEGLAKVSAAVSKRNATTEGQANTEKMREAGYAATRKSVLVTGNGLVEKRFASFKEAERSLGLWGGAVSGCLRGKRGNNAKGYTFKLEHGHPPT